MTEIAGAGRAGAQREWKVRLDCGHEIAVPWGYANPMALACIVQHRDRCELPPPDLGGLAWRVAPLERSPVAAFR